MPEGRNKTRSQMIAIFVFLLIVSGFGLWFILHTENSRAEQQVAQFAVVEPDAPVVSSDTIPAEEVAAEEEIEPPKTYTRIDVGNLVLIKQKAPESSLDEIDRLFENGSPIVVAKCYSVDACLKARQIMEPIATDDEFQQTFYTVIIEAFDGLQPPKSGYEGIVYMFSLPDCGMDMGGKEYTSTGLKETAVRWYEKLSKSCEDDKQ